jgi:hypothetical protein
MKNIESRDGDSPNPPIWDFYKHIFPIDFHKLILFIRLFLVMSLFYMFVWILRDRNADIRSTSYTFTLLNSLFCSILSVYYFFTGSIGAVLLALASFSSYMLADMYYGRIHYHKLMCGLNGYAHHIVYILVVFYVFYYDYANAFGIFFLSEIPTLILNIKYYFNISNFPVDFSIFMGFLLFRVLGWGFVIQQNMTFAIDNKFALVVSSACLLLHMYWTYIHGTKIWKKYISQWILGCMPSPPH